MPKTQNLVQPSNNDSEEEFFDAQDNEEQILQQLEQSFVPVDSQTQAQAAREEPAATAMSKIEADFRLGQFSLTLLYDHVERQGIQVAMREFCILFKKFDCDKAQSPIAHELHARNELFGIFSVNSSKEKVAILEQIDAPNKQEESKGDAGPRAGADQVLKLVFIKHNILAEAAAAMANRKTEVKENNEAESRDLGIDMDISVVLQPIRLTYRPKEIEKLINFFYVEDLRPETRQKA